MEIRKKDLKNMGGIIAKQRLINRANAVKVQAGYVVALANKPKSVLKLQA